MAESLCPRGRRKASRVMREFHNRKLHSSSGQMVTNRRQGRAIAMSEGRRVCRRRKSRRA